MLNFKIYDLFKFTFAIFYERFCVILFYFEGREKLSSDWLNGSTGVPNNVATQVFVLYDL